MRLLRRLSIAVLLLFAGAGTSLAHDPNTATLDYKEISEGAYILHIRTPILHLDKAVRKGSSEDGPLIYGSKPYKLALASYLKNNIFMTANFHDAEGQVFAKPVKIKDTALKLGAHETSIILQLEGVSSDVFSLSLTAPLMSDNPDQENIFRFIDGKKIEKIFLDKSNKFSGAIDIL